MSTLQSACCVSTVAAPELLCYLRKALAGKANLSVCELAKILAATMRMVEPLLAYEAETRAMLGTGAASGCSECNFRQ